jgi:pimeloyl-ACP methyl ester carboxylesterase
VAGWKPQAPTRLTIDHYGDLKGSNRLGDQRLGIETDAGRLRVPTTILWGRKTDFSPLAERRELAEAADARHVVFDDGMLLPHIEFPEGSVAVIGNEQGQTETTVIVERE